MKNQHTSLQLYNAARYYDELIRLLPLAKRRITIVTMNFAWGPKVEALAELLEAAARRKVEVRLVADVYSTLFMIRAKPLGIGKRERIGRTRHAIKKLSAGGVTVSHVGNLRGNPFNGRMHIKYTIIDDVVFSFGGVNFTDEGFTNNDYMLKLKDPATADFLDRLTSKIVRSKVADDTEYTLDPHNKILIDGGRPGRSIIYDRACSLARFAKRTYCLSQMSPSGVLAKLLNRTESHNYFNTVSQASFPTSLAIGFDQKRYKLSNEYLGARYMHAKCLLSIDTKGRKELLTGSHNFSWRGVRYGTKEMALYSADKQLWDKIHYFIEQEVIPSRA